MAVGGLIGRAGANTAAVSVIDGVTASSDTRDTILSNVLQ